MYNTILSFLLSMSREDAEKTFSALYTATSAATFSSNADVVGLEMRE